MTRMNTNQDIEDEANHIGLPVIGMGIHNSGEFAMIIP